MLKELIYPPLARFKYHWPKYTPESPAVPPVPYLKLPFRRSDLDSHVIRSSQPQIRSRLGYEISEGWFYSEDVTRLLPFKHAAVDYELPMGFPVAAPCSGYAMSSYYSYPTRYLDGSVRNNGVGYFVQIYNPQMDRFVQVAHLWDVAYKIPFNTPIKQDGRWKPTKLVQTRSSIMSSSNQSYVYVEAGETIGKVGYSGLCSTDDYREGYERPMVIDPSEVTSWSKPHIHMDEYQRNLATLRKDWRRDPYNIYAWRDSYPTHTNGKHLGNEHLFLTDRNNLPLFADTR